MSTRITLPTVGVRGHRLAVASILVGGLACLGVGTVVVLDPAEDEVSFDDLQVGDCLGELARGEQARSVPVVPCDEPHAAEVFATFRLPEGGEFPGEQPVGRLADDGCADRLGEREDPVDLDRYAIATVAPTAQSWADGDRVVQCLLGASDGSLLDVPLVEGEP